MSARPTDDRSAKAEAVGAISEMKYEVVERGRSCLRSQKYRSERASPGLLWGITVDLIFDTVDMAAPASFRTGIEQAASLMAGAISDKITVNMNINYSGTGGGAAAGPDSGYYENCISIRADLNRSCPISDDHLVTINHL